MKGTNRIRRCLTTLGLLALREIDAMSLSRFMTLMSVHMLVIMQSTHVGSDANASRKIDLASWGCGNATRRHLA